MSEENEENTDASQRLSHEELEALFRRSAEVARITEQKRAEALRRERRVDQIATGILLTVFIVWPTLFLILLWDVAVSR